MVTTDGLPHASGRRRALTGVLTAPAVILALALSGLELWRTVRPRSDLFVPPFAYSLADALATGNVQHAFQYVRAGQNPSELIAVRHPELTDRKWVLVSPLLWAIAVGNLDSVKMVLGHGARIERTADRQAVCLAEALGHLEIARVLRTLDDVPPGACRHVSSGEAPLLQVLSDVGRAADKRISEP
jgi:hypothetical protein